MDVVYRPLEPADYEPVREFLARVGWEERVRDPERFRRMLEGADRCVVALQQGRVIGFVRALCDGVANGYISMLAVAEELRGHGIGSELVRRLTADDEPGAVTWVLRAGRGSAGFWRKVGFEPSAIAMERVRTS